MTGSSVDFGKYWDERFKAEGKIWGEQPSITAFHALELFHKEEVKSILVPGSGYGRNTRLFSKYGFDVTGIEISSFACEMAGIFDSVTKLYNSSVLDMSFDTQIYDAVYGFNVLHLFREEQRKLFIQQCIKRIKVNGVMFFTVFSEMEESYGRGQEVEPNTFESKPGRPVHYFTSDDIKYHFPDMEVIEMGVVDESENHGEGPHVHKLRYIYVKLNKNDF